ncbi:Pseudouridine kinase [Symbiodinium microadriaticum]|uniref:Pseudouridine kinase n=1 Tax=Symbiodinium microadriaticum TaxID=2951 RepID=A0A1Q9F1K9_SYMMI|nr:Pseudouridine kinase [Symbiodinium microadriaticum]
MPQNAMLIIQERGFETLSQAVVKATAPHGFGARAMAVPEFHVVGDALVDVIASGLARIPSWDGDADAASIDVKIGGSALNTAVHLASLLQGRCPVSFYACVGNDAFGKMLESHLRSASVESHVAVSSSLCTGSCLVLSGDPGRAFITAAGAAAALGIAELQPLVEAVQRARGPVHVHFGGVYSYAPALRQRLVEFVESLRSLSTGRLTTSIDVQGHEAEQIAGVRDLLQQIDLFKGNEKEAEATCGLSAHESLAMLSQGGRAAVITCGASGAVWVDSAGLQGKTEAYRVEVKDPTGAGDAFAAALLASWVCGEPMADAVAKGCAAGALNCERLGGCEKPLTAAEVEAFMATGHPMLEEEELWQAIQFATYPRSDYDFCHWPTEGEWKGTLDKLIGYWSYLKMVDDDDLIVFLDAFDVFPNGFDGHELLRRFFSFGTPVVVAAEENIFPREVLEQALRKIYDDMRDLAEAQGYELWRYFIRPGPSSNLPVAAYQDKVFMEGSEEKLVASGQVFQKANWPGPRFPARPVLLESVEPGIAFKNGTTTFETYFPIFWHGPDPRSGRLGQKQMRSVRHDTENLG